MKSALRGYACFMRARVPALLLLVCAFPARAADRVMEVPVLTLPQGPTALPDLAMPLLPSPAPGAASLPTAHLDARAQVLAPAGLAQPQTPAAIPVLAASAALPAATAQTKTAPGAQDAGGAAAESDDSGWLSGGRFFDNALEHGAAPVSAFMSKGSPSPAAAAYAAALKSGERDRWEDQAHGKAAADAALALLTEKGVKAARESITLNGNVYESVSIAPEKGLSPLNDLAYELKRSLGVSLDHAPGFTTGRNAAYKAKERRIMAGVLDSPDFFLATLHEARHAWYSAAVRRGEIRLFHLQLVARRGRTVSPSALSYLNYVSFEELSTFPKTLKHLVTEHAKADAESAEYLEGRMRSLGFTYADLLRTTEYVSRQLRALAKNNNIEPRRMTEAELAETALEIGPNLDFYELPLWQGLLYFQVPRRETKNLFGVKSNRSSMKEARAALMLRAELLDSLVAAAAEPAAAYYAAVKAKDFAAASVHADRMIAAVRDAEAEWAKRSPPPLRTHVGSGS